MSPSESRAVRASYSRHDRTFRLLTCCLSQRYGRYQPDGFTEDVRSFV